MNETPYVDQSGQPGQSAAGGASHRVACLFETRAAAERAAEDLAAAGFARGEYDIVDQTGGAGSGETHAQSGGMWASIKAMFSGEDDADTYSEGVHRGHVLLTVRATTAEDAERVASILERHDPIDLEAQETAWRDNGWTGRRQPAMAGQGLAGEELAGGAITGTDLTGDAATMGTPGAAGYAAGKPAMPAATREPVMAGRGELTGASSDATGETGEQVIPLTTEDVAIGKRRVAGGSVRVRTHVVETPVNETVQLRDERVHVDRRPVDRAIDAGATGTAFQERSMELTESREEPVISKTARVTEEVVIRKDASERSEQVSETARRTEVDVQDDRSTTKR